MRPNFTRRAALSALGATAGWLALGSAGAASSSYGIVGRRAPDIAGSVWIDGAGNPTVFDMAQTEGKWVYLKCFQSWCPGCHRYGFPTLKKVADALTDRDRFMPLALQTVFEGFSTNTAARLREIQLEYGLAMKIGHDAGDPGGDHLPSTMRRYRTGGTPWVVIISPDREVVYNDYHVDADKLIDYLQTQLG